MAPRFFSKEWCEAVKQYVNSDEEYLKKTKDFTVKYIFVITDCPDGNDVKVLWEYNQGKIARYEHTAKKAPSDMRIGKEKFDPSIALMKFQVGYDTMGKMQRKEMTGMAAMGKKLFLFEGDLMKGMKYQKSNDLVAELQAKVPCEY